MNNRQHDIRAAGEGDLAGLVALLAAHDMPTADLAERGLAGFFVCHVDGRLIGVGGVQAGGAAGLLRSVVVSAEHRARGVARALVATCEAWAARNGMASLCLIAKDVAAANVFAHLGYEAIERSEVPPALLGFAEFSHLCPKSKPCLMKRLEVA